MSQPRRPVATASRAPDARATSHAARGAAVALLALFLAVPPASAQIGIYAGANRDMLEGFTPAEGYAFGDEADGFHIGIFLNLDLALVGLSPAVVYHRISNVTASSGAEQTRFNLDVIEIPIDVRLHLPLPVVRPYLVAGPTILFPSSTDPRIDALLASTPSRLDVGAGVEIGLPLRLIPEIRYGRGLSRFMSPGIPVGEDTLRGEGDMRLDTVVFRLGVSF